MKTAIVVGGNRGIGLGFVEKYLDSGYRVIATHRANSDLTHLINHQLTYGEHLILAELDLTRPEKIQTFIDGISQAKIDLLILSAGTSGNDEVRLLEAKPLNQDTFWSEYQLSKQVHLEGPMQLILGLAEKMQNENACIVYLTSPHGLGSKVVGVDAYAMTKAAGQIMIYHRCKEMMKNWVEQFGSDPEKLAKAPGAFAVYPGWVKTDMGGQNARLSINESVSKMVSVIDERIHDKKFNAVYSYNGTSMNPCAYMPSEELTKVMKAVENCQHAKQTLQDYSFFVHKDELKTQPAVESCSQLQN